MVPAPISPSTHRKQSSYLRSVLRAARPDWRDKDLDVVQDKLDRVGIIALSELIVALRSRSLNDTLQRNGEKRFTSDTLAVLSDAAEAIVEANMKGSHSVYRSEDYGGGPSAEPARVNAARQSSWEKESSVSSRSYDSDDDDNLVDTSFSHFSLTRLKIELKLRGYAPLPGAGREDLLQMLHDAIAWQDMPVEDLQLECEIRDMPFLEDATREELLERLRQSTWLAWGIPLELFESITIAFGVLEQVDALVGRSLPELVKLCQRKGLRVGKEPDAEVMLARLRNVAVWEQLPTDQLVSICQTRGLPVLDIATEKASSSGGWYNWLHERLGRVPLQLDRKELITQLIESDWQTVSGDAVLDDPQAIGLLDATSDTDDTTSQEVMSLSHFEDDNQEESIGWPGYNQFIDCIQKCANLSVMSHQLEELDPTYEVALLDEVPAEVDDTDGKSHSAQKAFEECCSGDQLEIQFAENRVDAIDSCANLHKDDDQTCSTSTLATVSHLSETELDSTLHSVPLDGVSFRCAQCDRWLPEDVKVALDGHFYCDDCWDRWCAPTDVSQYSTEEESDEAEDEEVNEWLRKWRATRDSSARMESSLKPLQISGASMPMPPLPELPALPSIQLAVTKRSSALSPRLARAPILHPEPLNYNTSSSSSSSESFVPLSSLGDLQMPNSDAPKAHIRICSTPPLQVPSVQIPRLTNEIVEVQAHTSDQMTTDPCLRKELRATMSEPRLLDMTRDGDATAEFFPDDVFRHISTSERAVQTYERCGRTVPVRFLYSSPLMIAKRPLTALAVRADLESLCSAEGIHAEVRVAYAECLREALLARSGPEILHISAHCLNLNGDMYLILEDGSSDAHPILLSDLSSVGPWDRLGLLVLLACNSKICVDGLLKNSGLRRAICCSEEVLDRAAHLFCKTFYQALGAGHDLAVSFKVAKGAVHGSPDPCVRVEADKFCLLGDVSVSSSERSWSPIQTLMIERATVLWPPWPRIEDYSGRESMAQHIAKIFDQRRAICLWGDAGSGKTALCAEFCRHFSAPGGRRFSSRALLIDFARALVDCPGPPDMALSSAIWTEMHVRGLASSCVVDATCGMSSPRLRGSLLRIARQLDEGGPWLLAVDGLADEAQATNTMENRHEAVGGGDKGAGPSIFREFSGISASLNDVHSLLADLLQVSAHLCILLTSRSPPRGPWASLGPSKVVEIQLPPLSLEESAQLLARRAARPFYPRDFSLAASGQSLNQEPLRLNSRLIELISGSPLGKLLRGNPGRIIRAAADVHAELHSLLAHPWLETLPKGVVT